ncbi:golgi apparatus membrane protein tvp15 [Anaeramoeba ignava]|uniref:Golgi apparatus membrane protein tvp15 n=1 Tax=Anaeramoeba ignava TaxID=1746090 RepID=A0A9Q0RAC3_ANAIG|nr:golgi apparatus membrane protein tvp15 [Anaeramoeba ignava]
MPTDKNFLIRIILNISLIAILVTLVVSSIAIMFNESNGQITLDQFFLAFFATVFGLTAIAASLLTKFPYFFLQYGFLKSFVGRGLLVVYASSFAVASGQNYQFLMIIGIIGVYDGIGGIIARSHQPSQYKNDDDDSKYSKISYDVKENDNENDNGIDNENKL